LIQQQMEVLCNLSTLHQLRWPSNDQLVDVFTKPLRGSQISYIYIGAYDIL